MRGIVIPGAALALLALLYVGWQWQKPGANAGAGAAQPDTSKVASISPARTATLAAREPAGHINSRPEPVVRRAAGEQETNKGGAEALDPADLSWEDMDEIWAEEPRDIEWEKNTASNLRAMLATDGGPSVEFDVRCGSRICRLEFNVEQAHRLVRLGQQADEMRRAFRYKSVETDAGRRIVSFFVREEAATGWK